MKKQFAPVIEDGRILSGKYGSLPGTDEGAFSVMGPCAMVLRIIVSAGRDIDSQGWEHVSVSGHRCPNWQEMSWVKDHFWDGEECVIQFHPRKSQYVSHHPTCLHLWRHREYEFPTPPIDLVGPRTMEDWKKQRRMIDGT